MRVVLASCSRQLPEGTETAPRSVDSEDVLFRGVDTSKFFLIYFSFIIIRKRLVNMDHRVKFACGQ